MKVPIMKTLLLWLAVLFVVGCSVTEEKVELWKGTKNGPKKLAGTVIDSDVSLDLRAKAGIALVQINEWDLFRKAFPKMTKEDSDEVILAMAPKLFEISKGENKDEAPGPTKAQVDAKDGLYILHDYAGPKSIAAVQVPLVAWCTEGNLNVRYKAGNYTISAIAKKVGAMAVVSMAKLLTMDQVAITHIAKLMREINDAPSLEKASAVYAKVLLKNINMITENHLLAAASIGGEGIAGALISLATNKELSEELQRFSLRAYSQSLESKFIKPKKYLTIKLFEMAENTEFDRYQREEAYLTIAQSAQAENAPRIAKLLLEKDFFWRQVGIRILMRVDGENQLENALSTNGLMTSKEEIKDIIAWVEKFPALMPTVRNMLSSKNAFAKAVAIYVVGARGKHNKDAAALESMSNDNGKTPKGFEQKTFSEASKVALKNLKERG